MEIWKDIKGYEGRYQVSNMGVVKSIKRKNARNDRILKPIKQKTKNNYTHVTLYKYGIPKQMSVHRIVYSSFKGIHDDKLVINHINEIASDNRLINLELVTQKENINHGTCIARRTKSISKKVKQLTRDGKLIKIWDSTMDAHRSGYISGNISKCCLGERPTHRNCKWEYVK
jgi:hypothetical protein